MRVVLVATGPSLTLEDTLSARGAGYTIAVNCGVFYAPWADALYACDRQWYEHYGPGIKWFKGKRWCYQRPHARWKTRKFSKPAGFVVFGENSGSQAIQLATHLGAKEIILLGYDHKFPGGKIHVHGDHQRPLGNPKSPASWIRSMNKLAVAVEALGVKVINCSRDTALTRFPRANLEDVL